MTIPYFPLFFHLRLFSFVTLRSRHCRPPPHHCLHTPPFLCIGQLSTMVDLKYKYVKNSNKKKNTLRSLGSYFITCQLKIYVGDIKY
ncbi:hypothetical protein Hanom_Chr16g01474781 [Helianthus anomalus]